jgi:hypothetical protein
VAYLDKYGNELPPGCDKPHLAVVKDELGGALGIPVGATILVVTDPTRPDGVVPWVLAKVSNKKLILLCACRDPECTRVLTYAASIKGSHPQKR